MAAKSQAELKELIEKVLMPEYQREKSRLDRIDRWYRWHPEDFVLPGRATREHRQLRELSKAPWLSQVVTATAQCMFVDGYRSKIDTKDVEDDFDMTEGPYGIWLANGWDSRQTAVHRAMLAYGHAYATCLPGQDPITKKSMPVLRGVSPRQMVAMYNDPAEDDWPEIAMRVDYAKGTIKDVRVFDTEFVYTVRLDKSTQPGAEPFQLIDIQEHGAGVVPVVRYCKELDLDGRTRGEVEPYISIAKRINKTAYDRLLVQHWNSWKIRWIAGMAEPDTEEAAVRKKLKLAQEDFLVAADADTKFGALPETSMGGFIDAHMSDVEVLAAVSQTPTHELTGQMVNLSAEALAAARASQTQKVHEIQKDAGRAHAQLLKLACSISEEPGMEQYVTDITGRVTWQDTSIQSMAAAVDALGKAATMLEVPVEVLWARIPGVEKADVLEWIELAKQKQDEADKMQAALERQQVRVAQAGAKATPPATKALPPAGQPPAQAKVTPPKSTPTKPVTGK